MALLQECPRCKGRLSLKYQAEVKQGEDVKKVLEGRTECPFCGTKLKKAVFWIEFYVDGRRRRERIGSSRSLAETTLRKRLVARAEGRP